MRWFSAAFNFLSIVVALTVVTPADAASLTLAWDPPTDSRTTGYRVFFGTTPGVYTAQIDVGFATQRRIDGLVDGVTYYFAVRAYDSLGQLSEWSTMVSGRVATSGGIPHPGGPVPSSYGKWPGGTTGDVSAAIRANQYIDIAWTPADGAPDGYRVEIGSRFGETDFSALTREHAIAFDMNDFPAAAYYVRVRPIFGATPGYGSEELVVSPNGPILPGDRVSASGPSGPCVTAPHAPRQFVATAQGPAVSLSWQPGLGDLAAAYVILVGAEPGIPDLVVAEFSATVTSVTATAPPAAYALRLAAVNACGRSVWAPEARVYVGVPPLPGMPQALTGTVSGGLVTMTWQPPTTGGPITRYRIEALTPWGPWVYDIGDQVRAYANANTQAGLYLVTVRAGNETGFGPATSPMLLSVP